MIIKNTNVLIQTKAQKQRGSERLQSGLMVMHPTMSRFEKRHKPAGKKEHKLIRIDTAHKDEIKNGRVGVKIDKKKEIAAQSNISIKARTSSGPKPHSMDH